VAGIEDLDPRAENEAMLEWLIGQAKEKGIPIPAVDFDDPSGIGVARAQELFRKVIRAMPHPRDVRQETPEEGLARLLNLLRGIGERGDIGLGEGPLGDELQRRLVERSSIRGLGGLEGIGLPGTEPRGPGALAGFDPVPQTKELIRRLWEKLVGNVGEDIMTPGGKAER
jgi:hypothetical protein